MPTPYQYPPPLPNMRPFPSPCVGDMAVIHPIDPLQRMAHALQLWTSGSLPHMWKRHRPLVVFICFYLLFLTLSQVRGREMDAECRSVKIYPMDASISAPGLRAHYTPASQSFVYIAKREDAEEHLRGSGRHPFHFDAFILLK